MFECCARGIYDLPLLVLLYFFEWESKLRGNRSITSSSTIRYQISQNCKASCKTLYVEPKRRVNIKHLLQLLIFNSFRFAGF